MNSPSPLQGLEPSENCIECLKQTKAKRRRERETLADLSFSPALHLLPNPTDHHNPDFALSPLLGGQTRGT